MSIGKFTKTPDEAKRYSISYDEWLDTGEYVSDISFNTISNNQGTLLITADAIGSQARAVDFFVSGGDVGESYSISVTMTTTGGQVKQDAIVYSVKPLS